MGYRLTIEDLMGVGFEKKVPLEKLDKVIKIISGHPKDTSKLVEELEKRRIDYSFEGRGEYVIEGEYVIDLTKINVI